MQSSTDRAGFYVVHNIIGENMPTLHPLLKNVKKQAQNLSRLQNIQLSEAYEIIAWAIYHCPNYQDLRRRILSSSNQSQWFELATLNSQSSGRELKKLKSVLPVLVDRLNSRILCNTNRLGLTEKIFEIFDLPKQEKIFDSLFLNLSEGSEWKDLNIDRCPDLTVLESKLWLNKICYRLLAFNVFMPTFWPLKEEEFFDIVDELAPTNADQFCLNITKPKALQEAVFNYIQARLKDPEAELPEFFCHLEEPSPRAQKIEKYIQKLLKIDGVGEWMDTDDQPIPFGLRGQGMQSFTYLIFGYPIASDETRVTNDWVMGPDKCPINDSQVFLLNGSPVALEWISVDPVTLEHNYDYNEYFKTIFELCSEQDSFSPFFEQQKNLNQLLIIKPASNTQIKRDLQLRPHVENGFETWFIKVENSVLAEEVIEKVYKRDFFVHENKFGTKEIVCKISGTWEKAPKLGVSLKILSNCSERTTNLITAMSCRKTDKETTLYITITEWFINVSDVINYGKLVKAMKNGLVYKVVEGMFSRIDDNVDELKNTLPILPAEESNMLNSFELPDDIFMNPLRFAQHTRRSQYERDSY